MYSESIAEVRSPPFVISRHLTSCRIPQHACRAHAMHVVCEMTDTAVPAAGNKVAFRRLLDHGAPRLARPLYLSVWGLEATSDGGLALPDESAAENPLLAVMLARLKEGCRLLAHVGEQSLHRCCSSRACSIECNMR